MASFSTIAVETALWLCLIGLAVFWVTGSVSMFLFMVWVAL